MANNDTPVPSDKIKALDRLVGTWKVTGGAEGTVTYRWMDGGFFLIQDVKLAQYGQEITGMEVIGHLRPFGEKPGKDVHSRFYSNTGDTLDYVYEIDGGELNIWAGERGSPAYFKGKFSKDGDTITGSWVYPGGGGYDASMTRVE